MQIVGGTYVGEAAPNPFFDALKVAGEGAKTIADKMQRERVANAQAMVAQVDALNQQFGARAFQPPPTLPSEWMPIVDAAQQKMALGQQLTADETEKMDYFTRWRRANDDYKQRGLLLGAAAQALKEAGGIKDTDAWQTAYLHGGVSQAQEKSWKFSLRPTATGHYGDAGLPDTDKAAAYEPPPQQPSDSAQQPSGAAATGTSTVRDQRPYGTSPEMDYLRNIISQAQQAKTSGNKDPSLDAQAYAASQRLNALYSLNINVTPEQKAAAAERAAAVVGKPYKPVVGEKVGAVDAFGYTTDPTIVDPLTEAKAKAKAAQIGAVQKEYDATLAASKQPNLTMVEQTAFAGKLQQLSNQLTTFSAVSHAGGTGQRQLTPAQLAEWERRSGDIHRPALIGDKEGVVNARAMAQPGVAAAVRRLNDALPVLAGGRTTQTPAEAAQAEVEAAQEFFREQMRQRGPVPRFAGGEYSDQPQRTWGVFPPHLLDASVPMPSYADGTNGTVAQDAAAKASWEIQNIPPYQWAPETRAYFQAMHSVPSQEQQDAALQQRYAGVEQMGQATLSQGQGQYQELPLTSDVANAPGGGGAIQMPLPQGLGANVAIAPTQEMGNAPGSGQLPPSEQYSGTESESLRNGTFAGVPPNPQSQYHQSFVIPPASQAYVDRAQALAAQAKSDALAGDMKKSDARMAGAVAQETRAVRATLASKDFKDFKQESLGAYRDWIDKLSQKELASYGLDDVAQAMDRQDNHALEAAKLVAQRAYWTGLLGIETDKNKPPTGAEIMLAASKELASKLDPMKFVDQKGVFQQQEFLRAAQTIPGASNALDNLAALAGLKDAKGIAAYEANHPGFFGKLFGAKDYSLLDANKAAMTTQTMPLSAEGQKWAAGKL